MTLHFLRHFRHYEASQQEPIPSRWPRACNVILPIRMRSSRVAGRGHRPHAACHREVALVMISPRKRIDFRGHAIAASVSRRVDYRQYRDDDATTRGDDRVTHATQRVSASASIVVSFSLHIPMMPGRAFSTHYAAVLPARSLRAATQARRF